MQLDTINKDTFQIILSNLSLKDASSLWMSSKSIQKQITVENYQKQQYKKLFQALTGMTSKEADTYSNSSFKKMIEKFNIIPQSFKTQKDYHYDNYHLSSYLKQPLPKITSAILADDWEKFLQFSVHNKLKYTLLAALCGALTIYKNINNKNVTSTALRYAVLSKNLELVTYICEQQKLRMSRGELELIIGTAKTQKSADILDYFAQKYRVPHPSPLSSANTLTY